MSDHDPLLRALVLVALALGLTVPGTGARAESASSGRSSNKLEKTRLDTTPQRQMIHAPTFAESVKISSVDTMTPHGYGRVR